MTTPLLIPIADLRIKHDTLPPDSKVGEPCLLCGRWILHPEEARYLELTTNGCVVWPPAGGSSIVTSVPNSQGAFPVGPDCYKAVKRAASLRMYTDPTPWKPS